jgi:pimeloyl-ACP methyl ester carboxylesterase
LVATGAGGTAALVEALEAFWGVRFPDDRRARWLANDPVALRAAWAAVLAEGPVSDDLTHWRVPCLICVGSADADFIELARQAAREIPGARLVELGGADHYQAHVSEDEVLRDATLRTLRANS